MTALWRRFDHVNVNVVSFHRSSLGGLPKQEDFGKKTSTTFLCLPRGKRRLLQSVADYIHGSVDM